MTQSSPTPVTQADEEQFLTIPLAHRVAMGGNGRKAVLNALARHRTSSTASSVAPREHDKPPSHWQPDDRYADRQPQTVEEWDWRADGPANGALSRSIKRLNYGADRADPHAPDQMATVLRIDIMRATAQLTWLEAKARMQADKISSLANTPAASSVGADDLREAAIDAAAHLAAAISLLEAGGKAAKKAAPSDKMFDQMLRDYKRSLGRARAALAASSHPASAVSEATRRMEETLGAKFVPASAGDEALREAEAWLRAISNWLLAMDHDMSLPDGILDTDPLDIADKLRALSATPSHAGETERLRIAQLERYLRRARRFIGSQPCKIADDIDAYFATDKGEVSRG